MLPRITLSDIKEMSEELDDMMQKEKETDQFAAIKLKDYAQVKLEESFQNQKREINKKQISVPEDLGGLETLWFVHSKLGEESSKLDSFWAESKRKIFKLGTHQVLEALKINTVHGFIAACNYLLEQPITVVPKPCPQRKARAI